MQPPQFLRERISIHEPLIKPAITNIGFGNPRYNSMVSYQDKVIVSCGSTLRVIDLRNQQITFEKQIGCSQIFQIMSNTEFILVVNFQGLLTFLKIEDLSIGHQFLVQGKQIRHVAFTESMLAVSCELSEGRKHSIVLTYSLENIKKGQYAPQIRHQGFFYYPEYVGTDLFLVEYDDPNPKGKPRAETVLLEKLPVKHRIVKLAADGALSIINEFPEKGEIVCTAQNGDNIYYLHSGKKMSIINSKTHQIATVLLQCKQTPLCIEPHAGGIVYSSAREFLSIFSYDFETSSASDKPFKIPSAGAGGNLSIKPFPGGYYFFNEDGLHCYDVASGKDYSLSLFSITNCGISLNQDASMLAVADFGGSVFILPTKNGFPQPVKQVTIGLPIRTLVWCDGGKSKHKPQIVIGCVGGGLYSWDFEEIKEIEQLGHTVNIVRYSKESERILIGTSDGEVRIYSESDFTLVEKYQAHEPVHYETEEQRELFGSMKNYAEIWSLAISPCSTKDSMTIVSSSEDQSERIFSVQIEKKESKRKAVLTGHTLAVTSIDWKVMGHDLGEVYVSCSDDKVVRFRNPKKDFEIFFELETGTIKQWHTLTYLALEPNGKRVAIGSQNGYLFIFDILERKLVFGEKVHLGGIEGLDWKAGKLVTCSSDLCISVLHL